MYDEVAAELATCVNVATTLPRMTTARFSARVSGPFWTSVRRIRAEEESSSPGARQLCPGLATGRGTRSTPRIGAHREHTQRPESEQLAREVTAAMYAGAMAELANQWLAGHLGDDLDEVVAPPCGSCSPRQNTPDK